MVDFAPLKTIDGYLPIEDHGLIGDGTTAALVARDGNITWLCAPRFDSPPLFCSLLDRHKGGSFDIRLAEARESRQYYVEGSGVLITEIKSGDGTIRITDALTFRTGVDLNEDAPPGRRELVRSIQVLQGEVDLDIGITPRKGGTAERSSAGYKITCNELPDLDLHLTASVDLTGLRTQLHCASGDKIDLVLQWKRAPHRFRPISTDKVLQGTIDAWRNWLGYFHYEGPQHDLVKRSAITLKMLDYLPNGAIVAAPTSSLPERIGGSRNWDYRYSWVRDAAFSVHALRRIGLTNEAWGFLGWVLDVVERDGHEHVLYTLDGGQPEDEWIDPNLEGYRQSPPVRWGNGAAEQQQHDVYGEIIDCAYQWAIPGGTIDEFLWERLRSLVEKAATKWQIPDHGIWEVRTSGRLFTYSAALCHVALDRGATMAERFNLPGDISRWRKEAQTIRSAILEDSWDPRRNSLTEHIGHQEGGIDASLLTLPLRRVIPPDHPKMVATTNAVAEHLGAGDGLLYRYLLDESPDGLQGHEGAFLLCSFWLVEIYAAQGRLEEAMDLYDSLCARANPAGLLPEQIDPESGAFLGNFPQAFSHVGVIASGVSLARQLNAMKEPSHA